MLIKLFIANIEECAGIIFSIIKQSFFNYKIIDYIFLGDAGPHQVSHVSEVFQKKSIQPEQSSQSLASLMSSCLIINKNKNLFFK